MEDEYRNWKYVYEMCVAYHKESFIYKTSLTLSSKALTERVGAASAEAVLEGKYF